MSIIGKWLISSIVNLYYGLISISAYENMNFISTDLLYYRYPYTVNINLYMFYPYNFSFYTYCLNRSLSVTFFVHDFDCYCFRGNWVTLDMLFNCLLNIVGGLCWCCMCCPFFYIKLFVWLIFWLIIYFLLCLVLCLI